MEYVNIAILLLLVVTTYQGIAVRKKLRRAEFSKDLFASLAHDGEFVIDETSLWYTIRDAQIALNINDEYRISGEEEWAAARKILKKFHEYMMKEYLKGQTWYFTQGPIGVADEKATLMFMLYVYLCDHEHEGVHIAFHKMLYISYMYCKKSPALEKRVAAWNGERLRRYLDDLSKS